MKEDHTHIENSTQWQRFKWWLGWTLFDLCRQSWGTKFGTLRYKIFKWCLTGVENYAIWVVKYKYR